MNRNARIRSILQFALAAVGGALALVGVVGMVVAPLLIPNGSGFAGGLAILFFGVHALAGFVLLAAGLLIPQSGDAGFRFSSNQRRLLGYGVVAPIASVLVVLVGTQIVPPLSEPMLTIAVGLLAVLLLSGPIATLSAIVLKLRSRKARKSNERSRQGPDGSGA